MSFQKNLINVNDKEINNDKEIVNYSNAYFSQVGLNRTERIVNPLNKININYPALTGSMALILVNKNTFIEHKHSLKISSSWSKSSKLIKICHLYIAKALKNIIYLIVQTGRTHIILKYTGWTISA